MERNDKIVTAILADAEAYADGVKIKATAQAEKLISDATSYANLYLAEKTKEAEKDAKAIIENKRTLIRLDENKIKLGAKRKALDLVFSKAVSMLSSLPASDYLKVISNVLENYAESGETAIISENAPITVADVTALSVVKNKNLTVKTGSGFIGGVILVGEGYEKRLDFNAIINIVRQTAETEISEKLF
jgi:vacuolar-type H+-ATPase subunit E/Vma4